MTQSHETPSQPLSFDFALSTPFLHACMFYPLWVIVLTILYFCINNNVVILYKKCLEPIKSVMIIQYPVLFPFYLRALALTLTHSNFDLFHALLDFLLIASPGATD